MQTQPSISSNEQVIAQHARISLDALLERPDYQALREQLVALRWMSDIERAGNPIAVFEWPDGVIGFAINKSDMAISNEDLTNAYSIGRFFFDVYTARFGAQQQDLD